MTFTRSDLLVDMSDKELTAITTKLVNTGDPEPIVNTIAEQQARMERYIHRFIVEDEWQKTMLRALVLWKLQFRLGAVTQQREKAFDDAMKELIGIRDGKFKDLPLKDPQPTDIGAASGRSGSATKYQDR